MKNSSNSLTVNREYKSSSFVRIFSIPEHALSLYNTIRNSDYKDSSLIEFNTIDNFLYLSMKNDVSFIFMNEMHLYEHQSTYNPNMPVRMMIYAAELYKKYMALDVLSVYRTKPMRLPVPKFVTFYNGTLWDKDETELLFSDLLPDGSDSDLEVRVRMININYGHNTEILEKCKPLFEYSWFVSEVRNNSKVLSIEEAVDRAIKDMPDGFLLKDFFVEHEAEVIEVFTLDITEEMLREMEREEGREEGRAEGIAEGIEKGRAEGIAEGKTVGRAEGKEEERTRIVNHLMESMHLSREEAMKMVGCPES